MQFRSPAFVFCFMAFAVIGGVANAQNLTGQGVTGPISFPPNYKGRIAALLAPDYLSNGEGQPEISEVHSGTSLIGGGVVNVCVQYPYIQKFRWMSHDGNYKVLIFGQRSVLTLGVPLFKRKKLDGFSKCQGPMMPFRELERAAQVVKGCKARREQRCVVNQEAGRRDTIVIRSRPNLPPAGPRLSTPE
jgi:hypothetical protein